MIDLKPTAGRLREHWRYGWWKYALFTVLALAGANFLFSATTPKVPYEQKVEVLVLNAYMNDDMAGQWETEIKAMLFDDRMVELNESLAAKAAQQDEARAKMNAAKTDAEKQPLKESYQSLSAEVAQIKAQIDFINKYEISITNTLLMEGQEMTMLQLMAARMAGQEGTIMLLPQAMFQAMAASGGFTDLKDVLPQLKVPEGTDLNKGQVTVGADPQSGEKGTVQQCGIPLDQCKGLSQLFLNTDMVLCFPVYASNNWDDAVKAANWFLGKTEAPVIADGATAQPQASAGK